MTNQFYLMEKISEENFSFNKLNLSEEILINGEINDNFKSLFVDKVNLHSITLYQKLTDLFMSKYKR